MEDFPILLLFLIIYLVTASSGKKGKKKKRAPMRTAREGERMDARQMKRNQETAAGFASAFERIPKQETLTKDAACDVRPLHLHQVTQEQMSEAGEGEDPCHIGGNRRDLEFEEYAYDDRYALGQDVLRGVVMSEILIRPQERRAMQRNRRGYHG